MVSACPPGIRRDDFSEGAVSNQLYGNTGKLVKYEDEFNAGFINGMYQQLEIMDELREVGIVVSNLVKGIGHTVENQKRVQSLIDIIADSRRFDSRNFANYFGASRAAVVNGLHIFELGQKSKPYPE